MLSFNPEGVFPLLFLALFSKKPGFNLCSVNLTQLDIKRWTSAFSGRKTLLLFRNVGHAALFILHSVHED